MELLYSEVEIYAVLLPTNRIQNCNKKLKVLNMMNKKFLNMVNYLMILRKLLIEQINLYKKAFNLQ